MNRLPRWLVPALLLSLVLVTVVVAGCAPAPATQDTASATLPALLSPQDAQSRLQADPEHTVLVDVRTNQEWAQDGRASEAVLIPLDQLPARAESELNKDDTIIVVCRSGNRSQTAAAQLRQMGFPNVSEVQGGMRNWVAAGLPIECDVATCGLAQ
jgi:rhodanese-related sulfurtransferase